MNKFEGMRVKLEVMEQVSNHIESMKNDRQTEFKAVGKYEEQAKDWKTGELLWDDDAKTIPHHSDRYDYVPKEELTDADKLFIKACDDVLAALEKLL